MKKIFAMFTCAAIMLTLMVGCGKPAAPAEPDPTPTPEPTATPAPTPEPGPSFSIKAPAGFVEKKVDGTLAYYVHEDGATICLTTSDKDPAFGVPDADALIGALSPLYTEQIRDEKLKITVSSSETEPICGFPAYQLELSVQGKDYAFSQLFAGIDAEQTYTWVFTGSEAHLEEFRGCIKGINNLTAV